MSYSLGYLACFGIACVAMGRMSMYRVPLGVEFVVWYRVRRWLKIRRRKA